MRKDWIAIAGMLTTLLVSFGLDLITDQLFSSFKDLSLNGIVLMWAILGVQVFFAAMMLLLAWFVFSNHELHRTTPIVFMAAGLIILILATPTFRFLFAELPVDGFPRSLLGHWPLFRIEVTQRLVEAAAFILVMGLIRLFRSTARSQHE